MASSSFQYQQWQQQQQHQHQHQPKPTNKIGPLFCSRMDKKKILEKRELQLLAGSCYIPKRNESKPEGEDAHFVDCHRRVIGVADGVGSWAMRGVDAGKYSRALMHNSTVAINKEPLGSVDALGVLGKAYFMTKEEGSSTACIIAFTDRILYAANVGDSGFIVIRDENIFYCSSVQQHSFNCPFQLGSNAAGDRPSSAEVIKIHITAGDIVVAGTDGLFDNLHRHEIADIVIKEFKNGMKARDVACELAGRALNVSLQRDCMTPFAQASTKAGWKRLGGKYDDITVVVAQIVTVEECLSSSTED